MGRCGRAGIARRLPQDPFSRGGIAMTKSPDPFAHREGGRASELIHSEAGHMWIAMGLGPESWRRGSVRAVHTPVLGCEAVGSATGNGGPSRNRRREPVRRVPEAVLLAQKERGRPLPNGSPPAPQKFTGSGAGASQFAATTIVGPTYSPQWFTSERQKRQRHPPRRVPPTTRIPGRCSECLTRACS